jgi:rare lipoprotein A
LVLSACTTPATEANSVGSSVVVAPATAESAPTTRHVETGEASWYGKRYHGRTTASGVPFDMNAMTAAHKTLPFGTKVKVTNQANGREVTVTINDRGPFVPGRIIDLSRSAAAKLDFLNAGVTKVRVEVARDTVNLSDGVVPTENTARAEGGGGHDGGETNGEAIAANSDVEDVATVAASDESQMSFTQAIDNFDRDLNTVIDTFFGDDDG